ncbi:MAG: glycosyltransferase [Oscillospiraceae bacterium]|nr:glycosyltransferase [Oscillospiraceae bacterium]
MKILFIVNNVFARGNGLSASVRRTAELLKARGHQVRICSGGGEGGERADYPLRDFELPVFGGLVRSQGYSFAAADKKVLAEAIRWADIVHLEEPFWLQMRAAGLAGKLGVPLFATYHLHPENLFASVRLERSRFFNDTCMLFWRNLVFDRCQAVQCPTEKVKKRLERWHFRARLPVISNGISPLAELPAADKPGDGTYTILCVGRLSREKDQETLLRAMRHSRYAGRIRLVFAGRGPREKQIKALAAELTAEGVLRYAPVFGFYDGAELTKLAVNSDLYVHCATVEVEGMGCMDAARTGLVPIIAEGDKTSTSQFALSPESIFPAGDERALAGRIDWWLADDERRKGEALRYRGMDGQYYVEKSVTALISEYERIIKKD